MYSSHGKSFQIGKVPVARYSHPLPRLSIDCSEIVNTNHPTKIKCFHMLCTKDLDESIYKAWYNSTQLKFYLFLCERQKVKERIPL
jgi:hypothetical protein